MKNVLKSALCIALCLMLCSCSAYSRHISDLTIVQAMGIDKQTDKTKISIQYLNLFENNGSTQGLGKNITATAFGKGNSISLAVSDASQTVSNEVFFGQNKIIVFGFDYAEKSIDKGIEYLLKSEDSRPDMLAAIGINSGEDILESKENGAKIPAESIFGLLKNGEKNGTAAAVTVCDLLNLYNDETSDFYLPVLTADEKNVRCSGIAVFSNEKYAKTLKGEDVFGFLLVKNKIKSGVLNINCASTGRVALNIITSSSKKSIENKDGKICFTVKVNMKAFINEAEKTVKTPLSENDFSDIEKECERKLEALCENAVKECFENKSDPFMCARYLYKEDMDLYSSLKDNWRNELSNITVRADAKINIQRINNNTA